MNLIISPKQSSIEPNQISAGYEHLYYTSEDATKVKKKEIRFQLDSDRYLEFVKKFGTSSDSISTKRLDSNNFS